MAAEITFQRERLSPDLWHGMMPLLLAHHAEVSAPDDPPLDIDVERYDLLDAVGHLRVYTARTNDDERSLVGCATFVVSNSMHSRAHKAAHHDLLHVVPDHRDGTGLRLLSFADRELANEGVEAIHQSARPGSAFATVLDRLGYHIDEITYTKKRRAV